MKLKEMRFDEQVASLRSALRSGKNSFAAYLALFAFRHHLASKHAPDYSAKPVLRWYLGQLAKEYIAKYFKEAERTLAGFAEIELLEASGDRETKEFRLDESLYPALLPVLEEIFGKEYIAAAIARAKYYRNPGEGRKQRNDGNSHEVRE